MVVACSWSMNDRFDLYGALYLLCSRHHSGQWSRGYRILSRLSLAGYRPGLSVSSGKRFESPEQRAMYKVLLKYRKSL